MSRRASRSPTPIRASPVQASPIQASSTQTTNIPLKTNSAKKRYIYLCIFSSLFIILLFLFYKLFHQKYIYFYLGRVKYSLKNYEGSIKDLTIAMNSINFSTSDQLLAFKIRGYSNLRLGNLDDAKADAEKLADQNFTNLVSNAFKYLNEGINYLKSKQYNKAFLTYSHLCEISTHCQDYLNKAAEASLRIENSTAFFSFSKRSGKINSSNSDLNYLRAIFYINKNNMLKAKIFLENVNKTFSLPLLQEINKFENAYHNFQYEMLNDNYDKALYKLKICLDFATKSQFYSKPYSELFYHIQMCYIEIHKKKGNFKEIIPILTYLINNNPTNELYYERGFIYFILKNFKSAFKDYLKAKNLPNNYDSNSSIYWKMMTEYQEKYDREITQQTKKQRQRQEEARKERQRKERERRESQNKERNRRESEERERIKKETGCRGKDPYEIFGLHPNASKKEFEARSKELTRKWHPDRFKDPEQKKKAEEMMKCINNAYETIRDS